MKRMIVLRNIQADFDCIEMNFHQFLNGVQHSTETSSMSHLQKNHPQPVKTLSEELEFFIHRSDV